MAIPSKQVKTNEIADLDTFYNGGKGSGNFGHSGRPGEVGGSSNDGSSSYIPKSEIEKDFMDDWEKTKATIKKLQTELKETKKDLAKSKANIEKYAKLHGEQKANKDYKDTIDFYEKRIKGLTEKIALHRDIDKKFKQIFESQQEFYKSGGKIR